MRVTACIVAVLGGLLLPSAAEPRDSSAASCRCRTIADYHPVWSPEDDALVYETTENAPQIFRFAEDHDTSLQFPASIHAFAFSPNWSMVAGAVAESVAPGIGRDALVVFRSDGSNTRRLDETSGARPAWSPSGERIAYVRRDGETYALYRISPDGSDRARIAVNVPPSGAAASWSPDGSAIAYSSDGDIFVARADGTGARNITAELDGVHTDPVWSPQGDQIAFVTNRVTAVQIVTGDGKHLLRIESRFPLNYDGIVLSWAPDGQRILYSGPYAPSGGTLGAYEIELATGVQRLVTAFGADASYSRDGTRVAFGGRATIEPNPPEMPDCVGVGIWVVSSAGGRPTMITRHCNASPATISVRAPVQVVYGRTASLGGQLLPGFGDFVRGTTQPCGRSASKRNTEARVGTWSRLIRPTVTTHYSVASDVERVAATVSVSPRLELRQVGRVFKLTVTAARSFAGRRARIDEIRQDNSRVRGYVLLRKATARTSIARFRLHKDASGSFRAVRATLPASQVGRCYAPGISNELVVQLP
jgi:Tol biopolymer transport system component